MSYTKNIWNDGDVITDSKMNNIELGVETLDGKVTQLEADTTSIKQDLSDIFGQYEYDYLPVEWNGTFINDYIDSSVKVIILFSLLIVIKPFFNISPFSFSIFV